MATLSNATASAINSFGIRYDFTVFSTNAPGSEQIPGHLVYYSTTGASGSWTEIPELSDAVNDQLAGTYAKSADVTLGSTWNAGTKLYILWVDDAAYPLDPNNANEIDNVQFVTTTPQAPAFANNTDPTNRTVLQCSSVTLTAGTASGFPTPTYQWYSNDLAHPISGATGVSYNINPVGPSTPQTYFVRATNNVGFADSHHATLTVTPAPTFAVISAIALTNDPSFNPPHSEYLITFNRDLFEPSVDPQAFGFDLSGDLASTLTSATVTNGANILLTSSANRTPGVNYTITLDSGVASACDNNIHPSVEPYNLASGIYLIKLDDGGWQYNESGLDPGPTWKDKNYNDTQAGWQTGQGVFDQKSETNRVIINGQTVHTQLKLTNAVNFPSGALPTYYFRKHFNFPTGPAGAVLTLRPMFDDAAIIYLNGVQIGQVGFTNDIVGPTVFSEYGTNLSVLSVGDASFSTAPHAMPGGYTNLPTAQLVAGDNVLAVELKQINGTSSDITMGLELSALVPSFAPVLTLVNDADFQQATLSWTTGTLQYNTNLSRGSGWHDRPGAVSPATVFYAPGNGAGQNKGTNMLFFRLRP